MKFRDHDTRSDSSLGASRSATVMLGLIAFLAPVFMANSGTAVAQDSANPAPTVDADDRANVGEPPKPRPVIPSEALDQINQLRKQMGGGVAGQLQELFGDQEAGKRQLQQIFDKRLRSLAGQPARPAGPPPVLADEQTAVRDSLRAAARQLDEVSADLEDIEQYAEADQIRRTATGLRQRARAISSGEMANRVGDPPVASPVGPLVSPSRLPSSTVDPKIRTRP